MKSDLLKLVVQKLPHISRVEQTASNQRQLPDLPDDAGVRLQAAR